MSCGQQLRHNLSRRRGGRVAASRRRKTGTLYGPSMFLFFVLFSLVFSLGFNFFSFSVLLVIFFLPLTVYWHFIILFSTWFIFFVPVDCEFCVWNERADAWSAKLSCGTKWIFPHVPVKRFGINERMSFMTSDCLYRELCRLSHREIFGPRYECVTYVWWTSLLNLTRPDTIFFLVFVHNNNRAGNRCYLLFVFFCSYIILYLLY